MLRGQDRLIVALDVPTVEEALRLVDTLSNVSFFKIGLKFPGDIANTIAAVVDACVTGNVAFLTLSESMPPPAVKAATVARQARGSERPKFLTVPYLSSLDASDLSSVAAGEHDLDTVILKRARAAIDAGCDGLIASGQAIRL